MVQIPQKENTTENLIEEKEYKTISRPYLGMSSIGDPCLARLWYNFRWASQQATKARMKRLFSRGDIEEKRVIDDLISIGIEVYRIKDGIKIPVTGESEQEAILGFARHAAGHPDGRCIGVPEAPKTEHLLEIKTMNEKNFNRLKKHGVQQGFPNYYGQVQRYMLAMNLTRTLFVATNKNTEERKYLRLRLNKEDAEEFQQKERIVIMNELPFNPQFENTSYQCKFCNHFNVCHFNNAPERNCRTCKYVNLLDEGKWECGLHKKELTVKEQREGCYSYARLF